jgi:hypothetical protein
VKGSHFSFAIFHLPFFICHYLPFVIGRPKGPTALYQTAREPAPRSMKPTRWQMTNMANEK